MLYTIRGIEVDFPYEAYQCQLVYMEKVIEALQNVSDRCFIICVLICIIAWTGRVLLLIVQRRRLIKWHHCRMIVCAQSHHCKQKCTSNSLFFAFPPSLQETKCSAGVSNWDGEDALSAVCHSILDPAVSIAARSHDPRGASFCFSLVLLHAPYTASNHTHSNLTLHGSTGGFKPEECCQDEDGRTRCWCGTRDRYERGQG